MVSPLLANIVLHELDIFIEDTVIPEYTKGKRRKGNREYYRWNSRASMAWKRGDRAGYQEAKKHQMALPSRKTHDPDFARLWYVRYADDSLLGWTGTKAEARMIQERIGQFLYERLKLPLSEDKTVLTNAREGRVRFLNYHISAIWNDREQKPVKGKNTRHVNGGIKLEVPRDVVSAWLRRIQHGNTTRHRKELMDNSDYEIVMTYERQIQGLINYYIMAHDVVKKMGTIRYIYEQSLVKTLAAKHKTTVAHIYTSYKGYTTEGRRVIMVTGERKDKSPLIASYGKIPICQNRKAVIQDEKPTARPQRTELLERFLHNECELCGKVGAVIGHHIHKRKDLEKKQQRKGRELEQWERVMLAMRRKTLFVCQACHPKIHNDIYDGRKLTEH